MVDIFSRLDEDSIRELHRHYNKINRFVIADLVKRSLYRYPNKPAIIFRDKTYTYRDFEDLTNRFANGLLDLGLNRYDRVAVLTHNTHHQAILWFSILKAGGIMVPINYLLKGDDIKYNIDHSESTIFIVEDDLFDLVRDVVSDMPVVKNFIWSQIGGKEKKPDDWDDVDSVISRSSADSPETVLDIHDVVQISYTSGTESLPKAVMLTNQSLIAEYMSCIIDGGLDSNDIQINAMPLYHGAQQHVFFTPLVWLGGTNILLYNADIKEIMYNIVKYKATTLFLPPTVWIGILRHPEFGTYDLSSLKKGQYGAAKMPPEVLKELMSVLPDIKLWNHYGQTEASPSECILKPEDQLSKSGSCGKAELNLEATLRDDLDNVIKKPGIIGEICTRGPHIMLGYFKGEKKTDDSFRCGWFHTGDLGMFDDDEYITVVDRIKDMVKSGGENVSSLEVEESIYKNKKVEEVAVVGLPHEKWIEAVTAVVVPKNAFKDEITEGEIIQTCKEDLAPFKVPKKVIFTNSLPKSPTGKILKRDIKEIYKDIYHRVSN